MVMKYLRGVTTLKLDAAKCSGCGMCVNVCPHAVFKLENHILNSSVEEFPLPVLADRFAVDTPLRISAHSAENSQPADAGNPAFCRIRVKASIIDSDLCMECGACALNCPAGALTVKKGVGCAQAVRMGFLRGTEPECGCGDNSSCC